MGNLDGYMVAMSHMAQTVYRVANAITHYPIIYTMFAGGLLCVGAKVFKKIKSSVK